MAQVVQQALSKSTKGAIVGAGVGICAAVFFALSRDGTSENDDHSKYMHLLKQKEISIIVDEFVVFADCDRNAFQKLLASLNKFCGLYALVMDTPSANHIDFKASWPVTATYYYESIKDSILALEYKLSESMREDFASKKSQLIELLDGYVYNVSMHTQMLLGN